MFNNWKRTAKYYFKNDFKENLKLNSRNLFVFNSIRCFELNQNVI